MHGTGATPGAPLAVQSPSTRPHECLTSHKYTHLQSPWLRINTSTSLCPQRWPSGGSRERIHSPCSGRPCLIAAPHGESFARSRLAVRKHRGVVPDREGRQAGAGSLLWRPHELNVHSEGVMAESDRGSSPVVHCSTPVCQTQQARHRQQHCCRVPWQAERDSHGLPRTRRTGRQ